MLKIFDCFYAHTVDLLYLLSSLYSNVYITKPHTSRLGNSEKYIVCCRFLPDDSTKIVPVLLDAFRMIGQNKGNIWRVLSIPIPHFWLIRMEEFNCMLGQQQIDNICFTFSLIDNSKSEEEEPYIIESSSRIQTIIANNIQKCNIWCDKFLFG